MAMGADFRTRLLRQNEQEKIVLSGELPIEPIRELVMRAVL